MTQVEKLPFLGFAAGLAILALAWGIRALNPVVRALMMLTAAAVILSHSQTVISQLRGAWRQL